MRRATLVSIVSGGIIAGSIDIGAAAVINWRSPAVISRFIASGLIGPEALHRGAAGAVLGLLLQWLMGIIIAAIFVVSALLIGPANLLARGRWIAAALGYGVVVFLVMNYIVVPLSAVHRFPHFTPISALENLLAMFLFTLIIALCARPALREHPQGASGLSRPPSNV